MALDDRAFTIIDEFVWRHKKLPPYAAGAFQLLSGAALLKQKSGTDALVRLFRPIYLIWQFTGSK